MGIWDKLGLNSDTNKVEESTTYNEEGVVSEFEDELTLKITDKELTKLKQQWESDYDAYEGKIKPKQKEANRYWLGMNGQNQDNIIFESLETFLPIATRQNPEPTVRSDNSDEGRELSKSVEAQLITITDERALKLRIKDAVRHWALYYIGVIKIGWDYIEDEISYEVVRPSKLILDPMSKIVKGRYRGKYIGQLRTDTAKTMLRRFPKKKTLILEQSKNKKGTKIQYIEWWTDEYVFWTLLDEVLAKVRNPHWNYDNTTEETDEYGDAVEVENIGKNHFRVPQMPFTFLSVFSTGKQPHDETSLIEQSIPLQNIVNKRMEQIDKNTDSLNAGYILSGNAFTDAEAQKAANTLRKGGNLLVPGEIPGSYAKDSGTPLPTQVYNNLLDVRDEIRNIFGIRGSSAQGTMEEKTVRGKIEIKGQDVDRIALVADYIEQMVDYLFNWSVQMMYVYYDEEHTASVIGAEKTEEYFTLQKDDLNRKLLISVKEGSMLPKDTLTQRNEAMDLWSAGAIDPITFYSKLDFPDPEAMAKRLFEWQSDPGSLFGAPAQPVPEGQEPVAGAAELGLPTVPGGIQPPPQQQSLPPVPQTPGVPAL